MPSSKHPRAEYRDEHQDHYTIASSIVSSKPQTTAPSSASTCRVKRTRLNDGDSQVTATHAISRSRIEPTPEQRQVDHFVILVPTANVPRRNAFQHKTFFVLPCAFTHDGYEHCVETIRVGHIIFRLVLILVTRGSHSGLWGQARLCRRSVGSTYSSSSRGYVHRAGST